MFNIAFTYLINILLAPMLRQERQLSWLMLIVSYLETIYDEYIVFRNNKIFDINFNGQLMYIEKKLQLEFNCDGIYIDDGVILPINYMWNIYENQVPLYIYNVAEPNYEDLFLYNGGEYVEEADFIVYVPSICNLASVQLQRLRNIVEYYKILEKNYKIEINE